MSKQNKTDQQIMTAAAMEGGGFYNRHSAMQAAGISLLLEDWETAVRSTAIDDGPLTIADYGSSQGRNSMAPMRIAIDELRLRAGTDRSIQVVHTDLPSNDFTALFAALADDPASYLKATSNVFASAVGRSYFEQILPAASVNLAWNSWTMHWMSGQIIYAPDHVFPLYSQDKRVLAEVEKRQAEDWRNFLVNRSVEMKPGANLLTAFVGSADGTTGWTWLGDNYWGAVQDLGRDGLLSSDEQRMITLPVIARTIDQIRDPFSGNEQFAGLRLLKAEVVSVPDTAWATFQGNKEARQLGLAHANMMRAVFGPTIANTLGTRTDKAEILDKLHQRFAERLAAAPQIHEGRLAVAVLKKL